MVATTTTSPAPFAGQGITRVRRVRDVTTELKRLNACPERTEATYRLRFLVARLCGLKAGTLLRTKNLQAEVGALRREFMTFLNGSLSPQLPWLVRILVRNVSGIIGRPRVIDRVWNDAIDLAEVHVRGSAIINELRRSCHHSLGTRTRDIAAAYATFCEDGRADELLRLGFAAPSEADRRFGRGDDVRRIVRRMAADLETLLGELEATGRIEDWMEAYSEALSECEYHKPIAGELRVLVDDGIRAGNKWAFHQHLGILRRKVESFSARPAFATRALADLDWLGERSPGQEGFDAEAVEARARATVARLVAGLGATYQDRLFDELGGLVETYRRRAFVKTFRDARAVRERLAGQLYERGFTEQRYYLLWLDCLLEELGYLALRHIATEYEANGVDLEQCLAIVRDCALNMDRDGQFSRELRDLSAMLTATRASDQLLNVLDVIERYFHKLRQRVVDPFEKLQSRLELGDDQLRAVIANIHRYMHDLNSVAHFSDFAQTALRGGPQRVEAAEHVVDPEAVEHAFDSVVHLSHRDSIRSLVEDTRGPSFRDRFGGKGSGLLYISYLDIPTRDGFILPTTIPRLGLHRTERRRLDREVDLHVSILEDDIHRRTGVRKRFGDPSAPLVVAVRGGSCFSMPGILSTALFVGMNDEIAASMARRGPWRAYDSYRRFLASFALAVWGVDLETFDIVDRTKKRYGVAVKKDLPWEGMREIAEASKIALRDAGCGEQLDAVLGDPRRQLTDAIVAVFNSWNKVSAERYREIQGLSDAWQTAATVQEMAFGNRRNDVIKPGMDETKASLTGVIPRTRSNALGERCLEGEIKFSAAGDDLVSGVVSFRSLRPIDELHALMPTLDRRLAAIAARLRRFMGTDQEIEFTVERGVLSVLQSRTAETSAEQTNDRFAAPGRADARGLGIRGGAFRGLVAFDEADRARLAQVDFGQRDDVDGVLLVLENPTPDDIPVVISCDGLLAARGGSTSHSAVAINAIGDRHFRAVMSAVGLVVDAHSGEARIYDGEGRLMHRVRSGDIVSIHGTTGEVYVGSREVEHVDEPAVSGSPNRTDARAVV